MKFVKILLAVLSVLVLVVVVGIAIVMATFDPARYKPELVALVKEKTGRTLTIEGPIGLSVFPKLGVSIGKTQLSEAGSDKTFARLGEARVSLALLPLLSGQVVVDRVVLTGLSAEIVKGKDGKTNIDDLTGAKAGKDKPAAKVTPAPSGSSPPPVKLDIAGVEINADNLIWRDEREGKQTKISAFKLNTGRIAEDTPGKLNLSARVEGDGLNVTLDIAGAYRINLQESKVALSELAVKVAGQVPGAPNPFALTLAGNTAADWGKQIVTGELTAKFDDTTARTKFELKGFASSAIHLDADIDRLDVDRYAGAGGGAQKQPAPAGGAAAAKPAVDPVIDLAGLKALNLSGELRIGQLTVSRLKIEKVKLGIRAAGGRVDLNPVAASLYGGTLAGSVSVNANQNQFALKQQLTGVNIGPLLADAAGKDFLEGRGNVVLDIQTGGPTVSALKKALAGTAGVTLKDGAIKGINLAESFRKAKSLLGSKSSQEQGASKTDKTDFAEMLASFVIRNGVAHNDDLSVKSPFIRLGGSGDINIGTNSMNYLAKASVVNTAGGQGGKDLEAVSGLTIPVRLSGPFDALKYNIEFGSVATAAVKQQVQEKVKEQVQDRLKGLLRR